MSIVVEKKSDNDVTARYANSIIDRDIIIITGCNAVGKTSASCYLQEKVVPQNKLSTSRHVADSQFLLEALQEDDQVGGFHHTHDWCVKGSKGHSHDHNELLFPFTVLDNTLPNTMRTRFFEKLAVLPSADELWFVEWAAGVNTHSDPLSKIDYSYATARKAMEESGVTAHLLKRILAIVHIEAEMHVRRRLNGLRSLPSSSIVEEIKHGTAFWQKDETVLQFYGIDDFYNIARLFKDEGVPIYPIKNDGTPCFFHEHLEDAVKKLQAKLQEEREAVLTTYSS